MAKLKVFRTPIGFHDAYVAVPSRKAALAAWGSGADLFARGVAEEVTDPALTTDALAAPGTVIRRSRGTAAEQLAALPPDPPRTKRAPADEDIQSAFAGTPSRRGATSTTTAKSVSAPKPPRPPKPSPDAIDIAEAALADASRRHRAALADLADREKRLARERRDLTQAQADEAAALSQARDTARASYDAAMRRWRGWATDADR